MPRISWRRLETGRVYRGHFNVRNKGVIANLPQDAIIEAPGFVDRFGINMVAGLTLPIGCAATCDVTINVQRMAVKAAVTGDLDLLKLAVLHDPLVGAVCTPEEVWQMVDEMVVAQAQWLPQYKDAIPGARERMKTATVKTRVWAGAARLEVRDLDDLARRQGDRRQAEAGEESQRTHCLRVCFKLELKITSGRDRAL